MANAPPRLESQDLAIAPWHQPGKVHATVLGQRPRPRPRLQRAQLRKFCDKGVGCKRQQECPCAHGLRELDIIKDFKKLKTRKRAGPEQRASDKEHLQKQQDKRQTLERLRHNKKIVQLEHRMYTQSTTTSTTSR